MNDRASKHLELLKKQIDQIPELKSRYDEQALETWKTTVLMVLENILDENSKYFIQFSSVDYSPHVWSKNNYEERCREAYLDGLKEAEATLKAIVFGIENSLL